MDTSGKLRWRFVVNTANATVSGTSAPSIDNEGNIYFGGGSSLYSITPEGTLRWQADNINWFSPSGPVIGWDGTIYIVGSQLWAFNSNGLQKWVSSVPYSNSTPAIGKDGTIYLGSAGAGAVKDTNSFYAFNPDGSLKFELVLRNSAGARVDVTSSPAISVTAVPATLRASARRP